MAKRYARLNWNSTSTYVSPENLNKMDKGINDCDDAIENLHSLVGTLSSLTTTEKNNLVGAINEVKSGVSAVNNNLTALSNTLSTFVSVPDDTDFNSLTKEGWYSIYSLLHAPTTDVKNRWLVHVENITASGVSIIIHTAFFYMGGTYVSKKTRHLYYVIANSTWAWSDWS